MKLNEKNQQFIINEIVDNFYNHNFGSMTKSDLETMIFKAYFDGYKAEKGKEFYKNQDFYELQMELGLTESRVRGLIERMKLRYPSEDKDEWVDAFIEYVKTAKYDSEKKTFSFDIYDPYVYKELDHFLVKNNMSSNNTSLSNKKFVVDSKDLLSILAMGDEGFINEAVDLLKKQNSEESKKLVGTIPSDPIGALLKYVEVAPFGLLNKIMKKTNSNKTKAFIMPIIERKEKTK